MSAPLIRWLIILATVLSFARPTVAEDKSTQAAAHYRQGKAFEKGGLRVTGLLPANGKNGKFDATDFIAPAMYVVGGTAVIIGVF